MNSINNVMGNILGNNSDSKPISNEACPNFNGPRQHKNMIKNRGMNMSGIGFKQNKGLGNMGQKLGNNSNVLMKIKSLMDQLPEVKKASGDLKIHLDNGDVIDVKLNYKDGGI